MCFRRFRTEKKIPEFADVTWNDTSFKIADYVFDFDVNRNPLGVEKCYKKAFSIECLDAEERDNFFDKFVRKNPKNPTNVCSFRFYVHMSYTIVCELEFTTQKASYMRITEKENHEKAEHKNRRMDSLDKYLQSQSE